MDKIKEKPLEELYRESFPQVARIVARMGGDLEAAKDIFHDAVIILIEKQRDPSFTIRQSPSAYLAGISRILWAKKYSDDIKFIGLPEQEEFAVPADFYLTAKTISPDLSEWIASAGQKCMELLKAFYYDETPLHEIAGRFNYKTSHSAAVQKHKCLQKIREQIKSSELYEETIA